MIPEIDPIDPAKVERVIMCSGKVYYDLLDKRRAESRDDIAIVRIEQLYPFPEEDLAEALAPYQNVKHIIWCQEEPMNQGAVLQPAPHAPCCDRTQEGTVPSVCGS